MCENKVCFKANACPRSCAHKRAHRTNSACHNRYCPDIGMNVCVDAST